jgi:hypothetical protein
MAEMSETTKLVLTGIGIIFVMWLYGRKRIRKPVFLEIILIGISVFLTCRWWGDFSKNQSLGLAFWISVALFYTKGGSPFK